MFAGRTVKMRLSDPDDMKYLYAAWRLGKLSGFGDLTVEGDTPDEFVDSIVSYLVQRAHVAYTLIAKPPGRETMPVGIVFGIVPFYGKQFMMVGNFTWFPWASKRNRLEATVHFLNQMRQEWAILGLADVDVPFFEHVCRYGVLRRVGTLFDVDKEGPTPVFQTRKPYRRDQ